MEKIQVYLSDDVKKNSNCEDFNGKEGLSEAEYEDMVYNRIMGMLKCKVVLAISSLFSVHGVHSFSR